MQKKKLVRLLGIVLVVGVLSGVMTSCKAGHETCPAYTKVDKTELNKF